jgi:hypothetical protein
VIVLQDTNTIENLVCVLFQEIAHIHLNHFKDVEAKGLKGYTLKQETEADNQAYAWLNEYHFNKSDPLRKANSSF